MTVGSKKSESGFLDELKAASQANNRRWEDTLAPDVRRQLDAAVSAYARGELRLSINVIRAKFCERFGVTVSKTTFHDFLTRAKAGTNG